MQPSPAYASAVSWSNPRLDHIGIDMNSDTHQDPYWIWAEVTRYSEFNVGPARKVPILLELVGDSNIIALEEDLGSEKALGELRTSLIQSAALLQNPNASRIFTAQLPLGSLIVLAALVQQGKFFRRFQLCAPRMQAALKQHFPEPDPADFLPLALPGEVFKTLGIVDDGCPIFHEDFRYQNAAATQHSRFLLVWDQSPWKDFSRGGWGNFAGAYYGGELTFGAINQTLLRHHAIGELAERPAYAAIGRAEWGQPGRTHGARVLHVMSKSAPDVQGIPVNGLPIIFVQMPDPTVEDTSGGSLGSYVVDAARYIAKRTQQLARGNPWHSYINISLGSLAGPHDGTSMAEIALDDLARDSQYVSIVMAAGNAAKLKTHAVLKPIRGSPATANLLVAPSSLRESYVEIWVPTITTANVECDAGNFEFEITTPHGEKCRLACGQARVLGDVAEPLALAIYLNRVSQGLNGTMCLLAIRKTKSRIGRADPIAPYGTWTITVHSKLSDAAVFHAWIERNDTTIGARRAQESRFLEPAADQSHNSGISEDSTLSSISSGALPVAVGSYRVLDAKIVDYSSRGPKITAGPIFFPVQPVPRYFGPSDQTPTLAGLRVKGFYSGTFTRMSGTSIAAPRVARWLAEGENQNATRPVDSRNPNDPQGTGIVRTPLADE
jgi:hypothetical protein